MPTTEDKTKIIPFSPDGPQGAKIGVIIESETEFNKLRAAVKALASPFSAQALIQALNQAELRYTDTTSL